MNQITKTETGLLTPDQLKTLESTAIIPKGTPADVVQVFAQVCAEKGISPFSKHIYLLKYGNKYQTIMGIDGFRFIAERTGLHAGTDAATFDNGLTLDQCLGKRIAKPRSCSVTVYKIVGGLRVPFKHEVKFNEFSGSGQWSKMPFQMIAKVAEAHALKKAFPGALSGLHTTAEKAAFMETKETGVPQMSDAESKKAFDTICALVDAYKNAESLQAECLELFEAYPGMSSYYTEQAQNYIKNHYNTLKNQPNATKK